MKKLSDDKEIKTRILECIGWVIQNIHFSSECQAKDISRITESAFYSGYQCCIDHLNSEHITREELEKFKKVK